MHSSSSSAVCPLGQQQQQQQQQFGSSEYGDLCAPPSFVRDLGIWIALIFLATIVGCYLPFHIIHGRRFILVGENNNNPSHENIIIKQNERHEKSMSFLMSFSSGVCLAVGFIFQANGLTSITQLWPEEDEENHLKANRIFGYIVATTFCTFFLIEQLGFVLQDLHAGTCELRTPCAVDVANAPLEAASVVRFLSDHAASAPHIGSEWPRGGDYYRSLTVDACAADNPVASIIRTEEMLLNCPMCQQTTTNNRANANHWVLFFLFALFAVHSLAEGLGLGVSLCSSGPARQNQTRTVALAILLHKSLSAFAVGAALLRTEVRKSVFWALSILFSAISPTGALGGFLICRNANVEHSYAAAGLNLIAGGTFLFVSLVEFLPKSFEEGSKASNAIPTRLLKTGLFLLGVLSVFVTMSFNSEE